MGRNKVYRVHAVVDRPRTDPGLLQHGETIAGKCTGNPNLNPPPASLDELTTALPLFAQAIKNAQEHKGMAEALAAARQAVIGALNHLRADVQAIAQKQDPDTGKATIESTGLRCKKVGVHYKLPLAAGFGGAPGFVRLTALAVASQATYFWQLSVDGKQWVDVPSTMKASTVVSGLTPMTTYYFRFRAQTRKGMGDWVPSITFFVR